MGEWIEYTRAAILVLVMIALVVRIPAVRQRSQRPALIVLLPLAAGAISIQVLNGPLAADLDQVVEIQKFHNLAVSIVALVDFACIWWLAIVLYSAERAPSRIVRAGPVLAAIIMFVITAWAFIVTPDAQRFAYRAHGPWLLYAVAWTTYGLLCAVSTVVLFAATTRSIKQTALRVSIAAIAAGTFAEIPYLIIHAVIWLDPTAPTQLTTVGFWLSFTRFCLVALGCATAAAFPLMQAIQRWHRRQRLHSLWAALQVATPSLRLRPIRSRTRELLTFGHTWEELHRQTIDIHDSLGALRKEWSHSGLEDRALEFATAHHRRSSESPRVLAIACSVAATQYGQVLAGARTTTAHLSSQPAQFVELSYRELCTLARLLKSSSAEQFVRTQTED